MRFMHTVMDFSDKFAMKCAFRIMTSRLEWRTTSKLHRYTVGSVDCVVRISPRGRKMESVIRQKRRWLQRRPMDGNNHSLTFMSLICSSHQSHNFSPSSWFSAFLCGSVTRAQAVRYWREGFRHPVSWYPKCNFGESELGNIPCH